MTASVLKRRNRLRSEPKGEAVHGRREESLANTKTGQRPDKSRLQGPAKGHRKPRPSAANGVNGSITMTVNGSHKLRGSSTKARRMGSLVQKDRQLIECCLSGDIGAWSEIYQKFHDSLLVSIRRYLNRAGRDVNLVEEIAARVWYALVKNKFELLAKFDVSRGCRLSTFLSVVAKNETRVLFRSERRRKSREHLASRPDCSEESIVIESSYLVSDDEFLKTLSQAERAFFLDVLVATAADREQAEQNYSTENNWQLRHRIRKKIHQYIAPYDS